MGDSLASITTWRVADFKALGDAELSIPQLTVLAGANSSGKSSVIQSVLMVAQTVTRGGPIVLNGPLVRLGLPDDVVRDGQKSVQLGFDVQLDPSSSPTRRRQILRVEIALAPDKSNSSLIPVSFNVSDEANVTRFAATSARMNGSDADVLSTITSAGEVSYLRVTDIAGGRAPSRMYLGFLGLTPTSLVLHRDANSIVRDMRGALSTLIQGDRMAYEVISELSSLVRKDAFLKALGIEGPAEQDGRIQSPPSRWTAKDIANLSEDQLSALIERAAAKRAINEWVQIAPIYSSFGYRASLRYFRNGILEDTVSSQFDSELQVLSSIGLALQEFGGQVRYLGPLRDEPRVVHGAWDERVQSLPVGIKGELTAEVLTREKDRRIVYRDWDNRSHRHSLPEAVSMWCSYLGIGDQIRVLDLGKLGRGVNLEVQGRDRDLTTIGVGASQLLPILVAGISAPPGSIVFVEQPELHLHPSVQSRLADFFLFARIDVRFVVETHSEYLITRIRRRIAEDRFRAAKLQVLFAEQSSSATVVRNLTVSELGDFDEWPAGFFDAQEDDARQIVRAIQARLAGTA
ncbi:DUF3696 domain-containing protein [Leifsonia sp. NPDC058194]|uniref:AAA family ATPase n=1 Tax=Leifsonia sp. NPDC058194 TaxID=3346374 RepID=UPI0036DB7D7A